MKPKDVLAFAKENGAKMLDMRFIDLPGVWQHFSVPINQLEEGNFEDGYGFDGSSIRGWQPINASDMLIIPDPATARMDPFCAEPTLSMICDIADPLTREPYSRDPRNIAKKAEAYLKSTGIGDTAFMGPEAEFFIFDDIRYDSRSNGAFYEIDSIEGTWNTGRDEGPNLGYKPRPQGRVFPGAPHGQVPGPAHRDGARSGEARHRDRGPAPRGGHRRPGRDRHEIPPARADGGPADVVQIRSEERRLPQQPHGDVHAQAPVRRQRLGHAHPLQHLEGRQAAVCRRQVCRALPDGAARHRRHPEALQGAVRHHQPRPPTPTNGWCPATRPR